MRYLIIVMLLIPSLGFAQSDWGPAALIDSTSWWDLCGGPGSGYGFYSPSVTENDSMLFFIYWCFNQSGIAYSIYHDGGWQSPTAIPDSIVGGLPTSLFYFERDSTLFFTPGYETGILRTRLRDGIWQEPESLGSVINSTGSETSPSLPSDGSRLYFIRNGVIMFSDITGGEFSEPVALSDIINNPDSSESHPRISPDGTKLYFNRGLGYYAAYKMRVSTFSGGTWQAPVELNSNINFGRPVDRCLGIIGISSSPTFSMDGAKMYFDFMEPIPVWCEPICGVFVSELVTGIEGQPDKLPGEFAISAYPNPFNAGVKIHVSGDIENISELAIYNIAGQRMITLPPAQSVVWNGKDWARNDVSSGIYFIKVVSRGRSQAIKVALVR